MISPPPPTIPFVTETPPSPLWSKVFHNIKFLKESVISMFSYLKIEQRDDTLKTIKIIKSKMIMKMGETIASFQKVKTSKPELELRTGAKYYHILLFK